MRCVDEFFDSGFDMNSITQRIDKIELVVQIVNGQEVLKSIK